MFEPNIVRFQLFAFREGSVDRPLDCMIVNVTAYFVMHVKWVKKKNI
jgi:hypothetical protein